MDLARRNGHDEWAYRDTIAHGYSNHEIVQTSLWRNVCGYAYNPQHHGVLVDLLVEELVSYQGTNTPYYMLEVFEGMNNILPMQDTAAVIKEANEIIRQEHGEDAVIARARGTICVEDKRDENGNPILSIKELVEYAGQLLDAGYEGLYIKSASGRVDPEFIGELSDALYEAYGDRMDVPLRVHIHDTYGEAIPSLVKVVEAAAKHDQPVELDGLPPAASGWVAHPDYVLLNQTLAAHPNEKIRQAADNSALNMDAIKADEPFIYDLVSYYSHKTIRYVPENYEAAYNARVPGGASATLRGIPGLEDNLKAVLDTQDWDQVQRKVFEMACKTDAEMGYPTMVTPYANMVLVQAAYCLISEEVKHGNKWGMMHQDTVDYLLGRLGEKPKHGCPDLVDIARQSDKTPVKGEGYTNAKGLHDPRPEAIQKLKDAGIENPTRRQVVSAVSHKEGLKKGVEHVVAVDSGANVVVDHRKRMGDPVNDKAPSFNGAAKNGARFNDNDRFRSVINKMGGYGALERVAQSALMLKLMDDGNRPFSDFAQKLHTQERTRHLAIIRDFLQEYSLLNGADQSLGFSFEQVSRNHFDVLQKFLDSKAEGLGVHIMHALKQSSTLGIAKPGQSRTSEQVPIREISLDSDRVAVPSA